jgi:hypothetical protein
LDHDRFVELLKAEVYDFSETCCPNTTRPDVMLSESSAVPHPPMRHRQFEDDGEPHNRAAAQRQRGRRHKDQRRGH